MLTRNKRHHNPKTMKTFFFNFNLIDSTVHPLWRLLQDYLFYLFIIL